MPVKDQIKQAVTLFFKGTLMGLADIVPGVSGGTIALITGIYEDLIFALSSLDVRVILDLVQLDFQTLRRRLSKMQWGFLVPLGGGIGLVLLVGSRGVRFLIQRFPGYTYSFFCGLILASAYVIYARVGTKSIRLLPPFAAGIALAVGMATAPHLSAGHGGVALFFVGSIVACAMILPGISGAFLLLLLGRYEFLLEVIYQPLHNMGHLALFLGGAAAGLLTFTKALAYLLRRFRRGTLSFLGGLMLGALSRPLDTIVENPFPAGSGMQWDEVTITIAVTAGLIGAGLVTLLHVSQGKRGRGDRGLELKREVEDGAASRKGGL
ncbi:MAG: DUF368 domain-containing protein [Candidatus Bipolaricaulota bacterium]